MKLTEEQVEMLEEKNYEVSEDRAFYRVAGTAGDYGWMPVTPEMLEVSDNSNIDKEDDAWRDELSKKIDVILKQ